MNTQPTVPVIPLGKNGLSLVRRTSGAPFPYVVLGGRDDVTSPVSGEVGSGELGPRHISTEREWFAAHVELDAPRWNDAREALVRSLAIADTETDARSLSGLRDDSAWDAGAGAVPVVPLAPLSMVKETVEPAAIKLRAKRRTPSLSSDVSSGSAEVARIPDLGAEPPVDAGEAALPILKDGLAPLVPLPALPTVPLIADRSSSSRSASTMASGKPLVAGSAPGNGFVKYALGMAFLCALIAVAGYLLFVQLGSSVLDKPATSIVSAEIAPLESDQPGKVPVAQVQAPLVGPEIVAPVVAETAVPAAAAGPVRPSAAFENYVAKLRVTGVLLGTSPRALINGRTVHLGDVLDPLLGIRLVAVDGEARQLVFEDSTTAIIRARY